jgi:dsDNA-binding SOS-regulon protein
VKATVSEYVCGLEIGSGDGKQFLVITPLPKNAFRLANAFFWILSVVVSASTGISAAPTPTNKEPAETWWSLKPVIRPALPEGVGEVSNPIDRFINAEHRAKGLKPVGLADKLSLLRRVYLDLIGIPPSPTEQEAFLTDASADAYEKVVDRLLESEQHAVRYARHWLDVLRYADADERMTAAPGIYLWRDWVINALHDDLPYDQFVQIQLTGRRSNERTQMSATGYRSRREPRPGDSFALGLLARGTGEDPQDLAISAVETVSTSFMGMTVGCAKCHDHLFDPISQRDFYAMKTLFDPLVLRKVTLASAAELVASGQAMAEAEKKRGPAERALNEFIEPYKRRLAEERILMLPADVQTVIRKSEKERTVAEQKIADDYFPILRIDGDKLTEVMPEAVRKKYQELQRQLNAAGTGENARRGPSLPAFYTVEVDRLREQEKSYILTSGDPSRPEKNREVQPGWPFANTNQFDFRDGRIEAFADWLTAPENPLFARVAVNRLWQWHFGESFLRTPSDFGKLGGPPSHPALLDWLASEFVRQNFSMKQMHRLMVTSQAYRMASEASGESASNLKIDANNTYLWHFRLKRLEAEPIWDSMHTAAGSLDLKVGGPSFDVREGGGGNRRRGGAPTEESNTKQKRRAAYLTRGYSPSRDVTSNFLQTFDVDDGRAPCPMRTQTVTAPQALFLMNSAEIETASRELAERLQKETNGDLKSAVELAYRITVARPPSEPEKNAALAYLENNAGRLKQLSWLLFNLDEFIYVR